MNMKGMLICVLGVFLMASGGAWAAIDDIAIATNTAGGTVLIYDSALAGAPTSYAVGSAINRVRFQSDGDLVYTTSAGGGTVVLANGSNALSIQTSVVVGAAVNDMVIRPDDSIVVSHGDVLGTGGSTVDVLDGNTLGLLGTRNWMLGGAAARTIGELAVQSDGDIAVGEYFFPGVLTGQILLIDGSPAGLAGGMPTKWSSLTNAQTFCLDVQGGAVAPLDRVVQWNNSPGMGTGTGTGSRLDANTGVGYFLDPFWSGSIFADLAIQGDDDAVFVGNPGTGDIAIYDATGPWLGALDAGWKASSGKTVGGQLINARAIDIQSDDDLVVTFRDTMNPLTKVTSDATELGIWVEAGAAVNLVTSVIPGGTIISNVAVDPVPEPVTLALLAVGALAALLGRRR